MNHREQKQKALWNSLSHAGIGRAFHRRSLTEVGSDVLVEWATAPYERVTAGEGWNVVGTTMAYDATILLARALHVQGLRTLVLPIHRLWKWIETDYDEGLHRVSTVKGLFVTRFYETYASGGSPFTDYQLGAIEEVLTERMDESGAVFFQHEKPLDTQAWWSPVLRQRIADRNRVITL